MLFIVLLLSLLIGIVWFEFIKFECSFFFICQGIYGDQLSLEKSINPIEKIEELLI
jgi:hypothetical protein